MKYRKKPVVIEAIQFVYPNFDDVAEFCAPTVVGMGLRGEDGKSGIAIPTLEGTMNASDGDFIIRGVKGELYPCKPDIFSATYDPEPSNG